MTINTINAYKTLRNVGHPFYAKDFNLSGSTLYSLYQDHFIEPTGNTTEVFVEIGENLYKKFIAKEWRITTDVTRHSVAKVHAQWEIRKMHDKVKINKARIKAMQRNIEKWEAMIAASEGVF